MSLLNILNPQRKTVSGVIAAFSQTLRDLKEVEATHEAEATKQAQTMLEAQAAHDAAISEAAAAREIGKKIESLLTPVQEMTLADLKKELGQ
jgi:hypothetical protein